MKTPREILLERHQAAAPKLDTLRHEFVSELNRQDTKTQSRKINLASWCLGGFPKMWQELIFPSRRIWAGLTAIWILIFAVNFSMRDSSPAGATSISSPATMMTFQQQERLLAELDNFNEFSVIQPPKKFLPRPRSERIEMMAV